jgi:hypothetical protein
VWKFLVGLLSFGLILLFSHEFMTVILEVTGVAKIGEFKVGLFVWLLMVE